jgi:hypothetical protein
VQLKWLASGNQEAIAQTDLAAKAEQLRQQITQQIPQQIPQ